MKVADFQNLLQSLREAGAYQRGNMTAAARVDRVYPESVAAIRAKLRLSQRAFSTSFGTNPATLCSWESGGRKPTGAARVLLRVAAKHPKPMMEVVR